MCIAPTAATAAGHADAPNQFVTSAQPGIHTKQRKRITSSGKLLLKLAALAGCSTAATGEACASAGSHDAADAGGGEEDEGADEEEEGSKHLKRPVAVGLMCIPQHQFPSLEAAMSGSTDAFPCSYLIPLPQEPLPDTADLRTSHPAIAAVVRLMLQGCDGAASGQVPVQVPVLCCDAKGLIRELLLLNMLSPEVCLRPDSPLVDPCVLAWIDNTDFEGGHAAYTLQGAASRYGIRMPVGGPPGGALQCLHGLA